MALICPAKIAKIAKRTGLGIVVLVVFYFAAFGVGYLAIVDDDENMMIRWVCRPLAGLIFILTCFLCCVVVPMYSFIMWGIKKDQEEDVGEMSTVFTFYGSSSPSATTSLILQVMSVITGIYSHQYVELFRQQEDGNEWFFLWLGILIAYKLVMDPTRSWIQKVYADSPEWRDDIINFIDFLSNIITFVVFFFFSAIASQIASESGYIIRDITLFALAYIILGYDLFRSAYKEAIGQDGKF